MCMGPGDDGSGEARAREAQRQARIRQGMRSIDSTFYKFNDDFFNQRGAAYIDYAMPQVEDQYDNALGTLKAALQRSGLLQSSVAASKDKKLKLDYSLQRQNVVDQGLDAATNARKDVASAKQSVIQDLYATADPAAAAAQAQARAKIATAQPSFSPLGMLFQNVASGLADWQEARAYNRAFAGGGASYGSSSDSGRVVK